MESAISVINTGAEEIIQHFIVIGCADKMTCGQTHLCRIPASQNVAEVPCGNGKVQRFSPFDFAHFHSLNICPVVIYDLGHQSADVDGVCGGETIASLFQFVCQFFVGENPFYGTLGIVKVSFDAYNAGVIPFLGSHLQFLHRADAVFREEYHDFHTVYASKAFQRRFSCITGGCCQNDNFLFLSLTFCRCFHKIRQDGQGHILECQCSAVEQFQIKHIPFFHKRYDFFCIEFFIIRMFNAVFQFFFRKVQIQLQYFIGQLPIIHPHEFFGSLVHFRDFLGNIQTAVGADATQDSF